MPDENASIHLVAYDPNWPDLFERERTALLRVIAPWLAGPVEHIGSTSVPGLEAKPVIDIMAAVADLETSRPAIAALETIGYLHAPYRTDVMHWFCKPYPVFRTHHLHLVPFGSELWMARLAFRDRLRADPETAARYTRLKQTLAVSFANDREAYTEGKSDFVSGIVAEAFRQPTDHIPASSPKTHY